jgi:hypothetical protein
MGCPEKETRGFHHFHHFQRHAFNRFAEDICALLYAYPEHKMHDEKALFVGSFGGCNAGLNKANIF